MLTHGSGLLVACLPDRIWHSICRTTHGPERTPRRYHAPCYTLKQEKRSWILAWQVQGLSIPESVRLATDRYRDEEDKLLLSSCRKRRRSIKREATVKAGTLFEAYRAWYDANHFSGRGMNGRALLAYSLRMMTPLQPFLHKERMVEGR